MHKSLQIPAVSLPVRGQFQALFGKKFLVDLSTHDIVEPRISRTCSDAFYFL